MTILVAGSDPAQIQRLKAMLRQEGYQVLTASTGLEALHLIQIRSINLVLLDPLLNADFDRLERSHQVKVIALPANESLTQFHGLELGLDPRIVTALRETELLKQVRAASLPARRPPEGRLQPAIITALSSHPSTSLAIERPGGPLSPLSTLTGSGLLTLPSLKLNLRDMLSLNPITTALFYLFLLFIAEYITFSPYVGPSVGLVMHSAVLMLLLGHAALRWQQPIHHLLLGLVFVPMTRILSLSLPLVGLPRLYSYLGVAIPLLIVAAMSARLLEFSWTKDIGLNLRQLPWQLLVGLTGLIFGSVYYLILKPLPLINELIWPDIIFQALIIFIGTGFTEELIYRGILQHAAAEIMGRFSIVYIAGLYASLHIGHRSPLNPLCAFILSLFLGWVIYKTRSLVGIVFCHGLTNILFFLIMPFLV